LKKLQNNTTYKSTWPIATVTLLDDWYQLVVNLVVTVKQLAKQNSGQIFKNGHKSQLSSSEVFWSKLKTLCYF
jgi:hypothetical protein